MASNSIKLLLQVPGQEDQEYHLYSKADYDRTLKSIRNAMNFSGEEYYVFLVHKSAGFKTKKPKRWKQFTGLEPEKTQK